MATNPPVHACSHSTQISGRFGLVQHNTLNENLTAIITHMNNKNSVYHLTVELGDILDNRKFFGRFRREQNSSSILERRIGHLCRCVDS
jgi:hypothetical protein